VYFASAAKGERGNGLLLLLIAWRPRYNSNVR
jgi:hypothetical protein